MRTLLLIALLALPVTQIARAAETCPPVQNDAQTRDPLFQRLHDSPSAAEARKAAAEIWQVWTTAPDAHAQDLLDRGMRYIHRGDAHGAELLLDELVAYCPDYAEGWNQRAFARYLAGKYDAALEDIERTLGLEPRHFGALAGKGLTLLRQGHEALAHQALRAAVAVHPWLQERHLLPPSEKI